MSKWQDIAISDSNLKAEFITRFFNGDYISAFRIIEDNPQLNTKVFLANVMNEISNLLSLLQNNFQSNVIDYLANELDGFNNLINEFNLKGSWDSETTYEIYNFVIYNNIDYLYINPTPSSGNLPTNTNYWLEINIRGKTGEPGLGVNLKYDWDSTIEYQPLDVVYYSNALWVATATNVNKRPDENSGTTWQTLTGNIITFTNNNDLKFKSIAVNFTPIQVLPDYQFVEYIESSGTQYIDTGISLNEDDFIIECRFARTEATTAEQAIVSIWEGTSNYWNAFVNSGGLVDIYTAGHHYLQNTAITNDTQYDLTLQRSTNHWKGILSGSEVTWDYTPSMNNSTTIKLFTRGDTPSTNFSNTHAKIYYVKIYRNGTLVGNFVPAVRPSDSAIGMYDSVSKTFFVNTGTGTFAKGSNITIPNPNIICPISGWTGATVNRTGKNLLAKPFAFRPVPSQFSDCFFIKAGTYTFSFDSIATATSWRFGISMFDKDGNELSANKYIPHNNTAWVASVKMWYWGVDVSVKTITLTFVEDCFTRIWFGSGNTSSDMVATGAQLELGSTASDYKAYSGTTASISFGQTVYGGTVVYNGDSTWTVTATDTGSPQLNWVRGNANNSGTGRIFYAYYTAAETNVSTITMTNGALKTVTRQIAWEAQEENSISFGTTNVVIVTDNVDTTLADLPTWLSNKGLQIVGTLKTPVTITASGEQIQTLVGVNNVWADTNDDMTIELAQQKYWEIFLPFKLIKIYSNTTAPTGDDLYNGVIWFEMLTS